MKSGRGKGVGWAALGQGLVAGLVCLGLAGCSSRPSSKSEASPKAAASGGAGPGIDLNCVSDHLQNPTEAFHYSYKKTSTDLVHEEADITPQSIDGTWENNAGSHAIHGVRSDRDSWQTALTGLTAISGMSSAVAVVNHSSAMQREGAEKVNGYDTIRYSIDTARGDAAEQALYRMTMGAGGFEKGMAWVTAQGCPVKLSLDAELHGANGSVDKIHYEEAMQRK